MYRWILLVSLAIAFPIALPLALSSNGPKNENTRFLTARPGTYIDIPAVNLSCLVFRSDPDHNESGPILYCSRASSSGRAFSVSRYNIMVTNGQGTFIAKYPRNP